MQVHIRMADAAGDSAQEDFGALRPARARLPRPGVPAPVVCNCHGNLRLRGCQRESVPGEALGYTRGLEQRGRRHHEWRAKPVQTLVDAGVTVCFTNPGTSEMHFVAALDDNPEMRCVLGLFEGVVSGAADGYARMADRPRPPRSIPGPGLGKCLGQFA